MIPHLKMKTIFTDTIFSSSKRLKFDFHYTMEQKVHFCEIGKSQLSA